MADNKNSDAVDRLVQAYEQMLQRVHDSVGNAEEKTVPRFREALENARERAVTLGELTKEEAEKVANYVERDIQDAAEYIVDTGEEFREWFKFDWQLIERQVYDVFARVADQTSLALRGLAEQARQASLYHAGEVTGPGTLNCARCGNPIHFRHTSRIPPCPECHHAEFQRAGGRPDEEGLDQGDVDGD